jgi:hypothetical protein
MGQKRAIIENELKDKDEIDTTEKLEHKLDNFNRKKEVMEEMKLSIWKNSLNLL